MKRKLSPEDELFYIGLAVFPLGIAALWLYRRLINFMPSIPCFFNTFFGMYCPGCGGTRASFYLARLDIVNSFKMNATVLVSVILYLFFMIKETLHRVFGLKGVKEWQVYVLIAIFVATVVIRWIVCNFVFVL